MTAKIEGWPKVAGYCPTCGTPSLFLGSGGWVTCSLDKCPNPTAVADLIEHRPDLSVPAPQPNPSTVGLDLDAIEAGLADVPPELFTPRTIGDGPMRRLIASVPALVAEVRRLRQQRDSLATEVLDLTELCDTSTAERDAARAEAERLRGELDAAEGAMADIAGERAEAVAEAGRVREALQARFDFEAHLARQREFSDRTFGPGLRTEGVTDHIRKELKEIEDAPTDLGEWIDVVILGLDGAGRTGATPKQIIAALTAKQERNERRAWPDWRTAPPDKAIEHVRALDAALDGAE